MSVTKDFLRGQIGAGFDEEVLREALENLDQELVDPLTKGIPAASGALEIGEIPAQNWNLLQGDLPAPVAVLRRSALEHNGRWMRTLLDRFGL